MLSKIRDCPFFKKGFIDFNVDNMHLRSGLFFSFSGVGTQIIITSISLTLEKSLVTEKMPELINFEILFLLIFFICVSPLLIILMISLLTSNQ